MPYWVYENWAGTAVGQATIHRGNCPWCNRGNGIHGNPWGQEKEQWHGGRRGYTMAKAMAVALRLGRPVRRCGHCHAGQITHPT